MEEKNERHSWQPSISRCKWSLLLTKNKRSSQSVSGSKAAFCVPFVERLEAAGFTCKRSKFGVTVSKRPEDMIPFSVALDINRIA